MNDYKFSGNIEETSVKRFALAVVKNLIEEIENPNRVIGRYTPNRKQKQIEWLREVILWASAESNIWVNAIDDLVGYHPEKTREVIISKASKKINELEN